LTLPVFCSGATGYIGGAILRALAAGGVPALGGVRAPADLPFETLVTGDLAQAGLVLPRVSAVVHAAGLGHRRGVSPRIWAAQNVTAAVNLARAARAAGAEKFILISTAHVHGRVHEGVVSDATPPNPMDEYAQSKLTAEHEAAAVFGPGFVAIRPAAVIGPGCPGNIQLLLRCLSRGIPLPLGSLTNRRTFIDRADLAAITLAALRAETPPEAVLAAHPVPISTPALVCALAAGLGRRPRLLACPPALLGAAARLAGRGAMWQSLAGSLVVDPLAALGLGWKPAATLEESLLETARYYVTA
jgi:UDP-glucose 4-epimerase